MYVSTTSTAAWACITSTWLSARRSRTKSQASSGSVFGSEPSKEEIDARAERYQVRLTTVGDSVQVTVEKDLNTIAPADVARKVLDLIQENLG